MKKSKIKNTEKDISCVKNGNTFNMIPITSYHVFMTIYYIFAENQKKLKNLMKKNTSVVFSFFFFDFLYVGSPKQNFLPPMFFWAELHWQ